MVKNVRVDSYFDIHQKFNFANNVNYDLTAFDRRYLYYSFFLHAEAPVNINR